MNKPILEIKDLTIALPKNADRNFAVENANLDVFKGNLKRYLKRYLKKVFEKVLEKVT